MAIFFDFFTRKCEIRIKGMDYEKYEMTRNRFKRIGYQRYEGRERVSMMRLPHVRIPILDDG